MLQETFTVPLIRMEYLIAELDLRGLHSTAAYLKNKGHELFSETRLREQGIAPVLVMVVTGGEHIDKLSKTNIIKSQGGSLSGKITEKRQVFNMLPNILVTYGAAGVFIPNPADTSNSA